MEPNFTQQGELGSEEDNWTGTGPRQMKDGRWWSPESGWIVDEAQVNLEFQQNAGRMERNAGPERVYNPHEDAARFGKMSDPRFTTGPQIDTARPDESRGLSMDALSMLQRRASGGTTPAQLMQQQQTAGAVAGIQSGAASIKGGAMARAAAGRGAQTTGARVNAQGQQDNAALRAREMADATNQYFGAAQGQRGRDLSLATSQADLDAKQRAENEARDAFYQGLAFDQKKTTVDDALGRTAADSAAENAARIASLNESAATAKRATDVANAGLNAATGGINAYNASQNEGGAKKSSDPWDPKNFSGSDPKTKRAIKPVTDAEAKRLKARGDDMIAQTKANAALFGDRKEYDGKYLDSPFPEAKKKEALPKAAPKFKDVLDDRFGEGGESRGDPYKTPPPPTGVTGAPKGYAASRNGQMGSMFGSTMRHEYDLGSGYSDDPSKNYQSRQQIRPENTWAPGSADLYAGSHARDMATSDPKAKRAAFIDGLNHANEAADTGKFGEVPEYMSEPSVQKAQPKAASNRAASTTVKKADPAWQRAMVKRSEADLDSANIVEYGAHAAGGGTGIYGAYGSAAGDTYRMNVKDDSERMRQRSQRPASLPAIGTREMQSFSRDYVGAPPQAPPPEAPGIASTLGDYAEQARAMVPSDPKTKNIDDKFGGPMADANRSMEPSSYEYKPEFLPAEQEPGETNVGPMADKMEADPVAGTAIVRDPKNGMLAIDKTKGLKLVMGGLASLQRQVDHMGGHR